MAVSREVAKLAKIAKKMHGTSDFDAPQNQDTIE